METSLNCFLKNKANLRDLIAATGLVISNWIQIVNFSARVTVKFDGWPGFTVQKRSIQVEIGDMLSRVTLKFDGWPWKTIGHLFYATSSFVQHFIVIGEFKLELQSGNAQSGSNSIIFRPCDLEIWRITLQNSRAPLLCYFELCASFRTHWVIQT